jgi:hypothetical protein
MTRLRIWSDGDWPIGATAVGNVALEWIGRSGHPSSYAPLGGNLSSMTVRLDVREEDEAFNDSLAGVSDDVRFGLPIEYRQSVMDGLARVLGSRGCQVTVAAHGLVGSSPIAFGQVAGLLGRPLFDPLLCDAADEELWRVLGECASAART